MEKLLELLQTADQLLGPQGCAWMAQQTLNTMCCYLIEETYEVVDAIHRENREDLIEELGDLLFLILCCSVIGARERGISLDEVCQHETDKLIRRHPHVFSLEGKELSLDEIRNLWDQVKKKEKAARFGEIAATLPALQKTQKVVKYQDNVFDVLDKGNYTEKEKELAQELVRLSICANQHDIDLEALLTRLCHQSLEKK